MQKYGITAEQAGDWSPDLKWLLREKKGHARPYAPGDRPLAGVPGVPQPADERGRALDRGPARGRRRRHARLRRGPRDPGRMAARRRDAGAAGRRGEGERRLGHYWGTADAGCARGERHETAQVQGLRETGATGLEPAFSGVTGRETQQAASGPARPRRAGKSLGQRFPGLVDRLVAPVRRRPSRGRSDVFRTSDKLASRRSQPERRDWMGMTFRFRLVLSDGSPA
jgi:hypothetical protein